MRLDRMLADVEVLDRRGDPSAVEVTSIAYRSQAVGSGALFCCLPGLTVDGHLFAPDAIEKGAVALLTERLLDDDRVSAAAQVVVADARVAMASIAATFHTYPSRRVSVAGVTGTNGKTSTTHLLAAALTAAGRRAEPLGTLSGPRTTPEAPDLQAALADAADRGVRAVALEVSSHALVQHRVDATWFEMVVFTNLSPEHLDFHADMADYFAAKASLFVPERAAAAVVNADDEWGRRLLDAARIPTRAFTMDDARELSVTATGARFRWRGHAVELRSTGRFAVANALAAATAAAELGSDPAAVAEGISKAGVVPGRFELVAGNAPFTTVVDYAHTPGGLEASLLAAREIAGTARVIVVFGCGGNRDAAKRPLMGEVASRLADQVVLTDDNPRGENPSAIIDAIRAGMPESGRAGNDVTVQPDRRAAIAAAIASARDGDVVVVAGKGHETVQEIGGELRPFDDRRVAAEELERRWSQTAATAAATPSGEDH